MRRHTYDCGRYNFAPLVGRLFDCKDLRFIHERLPKHIKYNELHKLGEDNKTWYHNVFYEPINRGESKVQSLYENFIKDVISHKVECKKFLYQKSPTFRVHAPGNIADGGWHRDRDYNHSPHEINFFLPLTPAVGNNTIWVESEEDRADYAPMNCDYGQFYIWDGANLKHGNKVNDTGVSRVSIDFRILPYDKYDVGQAKSSVSAGKKFIIGDYYKLYER